MNIYKHVIWDVDGTLLDTSLGMISSVKYMIEKCNLDTIDDETLNSFVGPRIQDSLRRVYGMEGNDLLEASKVFRNRYKEGDVLVAKPYDGIEELLSELKNKEIVMSIATNKRQDFVDALVSKFEMDNYFEGVYGTDMGGKYTKDDLIRLCISKHPNIPLKETVMIGDSKYDADAAKMISIDFIGVTYGFDFKSPEDIRAYNPVFVANKVSEIKDFLLRRYMKGE